MATRQPQGQDDLAAEPRSIELRDYAMVLRRRWVLVLVVMIIGVGLAAAYSKHKGHVYAAISEVVVEPATQGPLNPPAAPNLQVNMVTEQAVAESAPVAALAAKLLHSPQSAGIAEGKLASHLTVMVPTLSNVLQITWQAGSPKAAQAGADAFANAYLNYRHDLLSAQINRLSATLTAQVKQLEKEIKGVSAQLNGSSGSAQRTLNTRLSQLTGQQTQENNTLAALPTYNVSGGNVIEAALPLSPAGLKRSLLLILGALLGLLAGAVAAFIREAFDDRLLDPAALERKLGAPTLAVLPGVSGPPGPPGSGSERAQRRRGGVVTVASPDSAAADTFRGLRTMLTSVAAGKGLSSIVVVGVDGSVSASQVAAELSVALAESGRKTLLIAADIRDSTLPLMFGLPKAGGLTNILVGKADPAGLTQHPRHANGVALSPAVARQLSIIPTGPPIAHPLTMLDSVAMARFLKSLRDDYDFVVLDSPPADAAADFLALARLVDGVIVVAGEARSRGQAAENLRQRLDRIGGYIAGGVFISRRGRALGARRPLERSEASLLSGPFAGRPAEVPAGAKGNELPAAARPAAGPFAAQPAEGSGADRPGAAKPADQKAAVPDGGDAAPDGPQRLARRPS